MAIDDLPLNEEAPVNASELIKRLRFWAGVIALGAAVLGIVSGRALGEGSLSLIASGLLLAASVPDSNSNTPKEILTQIRNEFNIRIILSGLVKLVRYFFQYGDSLIRFMLIVAAFGGTTWVIKAAIGLNYIPDWIDVWIKRLGPGLALVSIVLYPAYLISKRLFVLSNQKRGIDVHSYEALFYINIMILCFAIITFFTGFPLESFSGISTTGNRPAQAFTWNKREIIIILSINAISFIWAVCFAACLLSKYFEWSWRDKPMKR
ncbi:hypothetical protein [Bosea sp. LjRoot237]|uniref:hypothetical protein n=1 Tax=Bosea sp. LjRoot237 TaxID=3342292 RepID=UPI003ECE49A1